MSTWTSRTYERHDGSLHLSCAETAKLIRKALKAAFPTTKFSVRSSSYSMGASVHITWVDGPTQSQVNKVAGVYAGADFDGMVDLKIYNEHWLEPDGSVKIASGGGGGSTIPEVIGDAPSPDARLVSFGADFVQCQRSLSPEVSEKIKLEIGEFLGKPFEQAKVNGGLPISVFKLEGGGSALALDSRGSLWDENAVWQVGALRDYSKPCEHPATLRYPVGGGRERCGGCGV